MNAIDQLPSEDSDRPHTPEEPLSMPAPIKKCYLCGCQCVLLNNLKWRLLFFNGIFKYMFYRCSSRLCNEWNGFHQPYNIPVTSVDVEQAEITRALNSIKAETEVFENIHEEHQNTTNQQQYNNLEMNNKNYENSQITTKFQPVRNTEYASNYPLYEGNYSDSYNITRKKIRSKT